MNAKALIDQFYLNYPDPYHLPAVILFYTAAILLTAVIFLLFLAPKQIRQFFKQHSSATEKVCLAAFTIGIISAIASASFWVISDTNQIKHWQVAEILNNTHFAVARDQFDNVVISKTDPDTVFDDTPTSQRSIHLKPDDATTLAHFLRDRIPSKYPPFKSIGL